MKNYFLITFLILGTVSNAFSKNECAIEQRIDTIKDFREFKVLDSKYINNDALWAPFNKDLKDFSEATYLVLKPLILDQNIPTLQKNIAEGKLTYEKLVLFYLYRIRKFDRENMLSLNAVIALNPNVVAEARQKDKEPKPLLGLSVFGMPILLKDNINVAGMPTTAGAAALQQNMAEDAFIVKQLKNNGALILGKANLSEWAYFFCGDCPSGYSAVGGQTLNPYGRRIFDTGGSSSGSGVAVAANFCVAAVGSETSGSILSPSSQNSVVGLKPTIGLLSRTGIIPISSTLDTPGPITKNVIDNAIMLEAMTGFDKDDSASVASGQESFSNLNNILKGRRFGAFKGLMEDSLYVEALSKLKNEGAEIIEIEQPQINLPGFIRLLNLDMKKDLPVYFQKNANAAIALKSVEDVMEFNRKDSLRRAPYGQALFKGIVADKGSSEDLERIKDTLSTNGKLFFEGPMKMHNLDGILSINNFYAGYAAVAKYPALTIPMGYQKDGKPRGLTFIAKPFQEEFLLQWAYEYEKASKKRIAPKNYN
ncbi:MAG: amidase family protein [Lutibacter sp.]|nr:amidase family protein [Lutibacter sp.]MDT8418404.1 amidase family protein [Lutibacter sp.]